jgi:hypothetical protein
MQASGFQIQESDGSSYGAQLKVLQEEIEAVDRAIDEEKRLALDIEAEGTVQSRRRPKLVKGT